MSRTYRRTKRGAEVAHQIDFNEIEYEYDAYGFRIERDRTEKEVAKAKAEFYGDGYWTMTTPSWWYKMTTTVPARREERDIIKSLLKAKYLDELEAAMFPTWNKPKIYFW